MPLQGLRFRGKSRVVAQTMLATYYVMFVVYLRGGACLPTYSMDTQSAIYNMLVILLDVQLPPGFRVK
jgi:hypothetical protein